MGGAPVTFTLAVMKPVLLATITLLFPSIGLAQTLCSSGEIDYFSCMVAHEKIVSVCGNIANGEVKKDSWLQYRFGKPGAIELAYPKEKQASVRQFEGNYFSRYNVIDLRFINDSTLYGVDLNDTYSGDDAKKRPRPTGGVSVQVEKAKGRRIECQKADAGKYFEVFSLLNSSLRNYNGETDFLHQFHNRASR